MRPLTVGIVGLAIAAGVREQRAHVRDMDDFPDAPLSLHQPTGHPNAATAGPEPLGDAVWPSVSELPAFHSYNVTRTGVEVELDGKKYFLSGQPRAANCHADVNGTYGRHTIGFVKASCPTQDSDEPQPESVYNTYRFSQEPNRTYLERPPVSVNASLCASVRGWDPVEQQDVPLQGELVQPLSMRHFIYEETCTVAASAPPTESGTPRDTSKPGDPISPVTDDTMTSTVTALAVLGTVVGVSACLYKGIVADRVLPVDHARDLRPVELQVLPNA